MRAYKSLPSRKLSHGVDLVRPADKFGPRVTLESPAPMVMTDFARIEPAGIRLHATMDMANQTMIRLGVRLLFVLDAHDHLAGLITATDILGEKPMRLVQERGLRHSEVQVEDLMTPVEALEALEYDEVSHATVGHVVATLKAAGRQHTLVVQHDADGGVLIRGIFSVSQISRQLGAAIQTSAAASTFSELVNQLG
ncbi:MAG TPA: CBS domain-containing protein [Burkholderiales bacterium]|jgi:CBS-domain-containing membrane protein